jgi:hypothetical protein
MKNSSNFKNNISYYFDGHLIFQRLWIGSVQKIALREF